MELNGGTSRTGTSDLWVLVRACAIKTVFTHFSFCFTLLHNLWPAINEFTISFESKISSECHRRKVCLLSAIQTQVELFVVLFTAMNDVVVSEMNTENMFVSRKNLFSYWNRNEINDNYRKSHGNRLQFTFTKSTGVCVKVRAVGLNWVTHLCCNGHSLHCIVHCAAATMHPATRPQRRATFARMQSFVLINLGKKKTKTKSNRVKIFNVNYYRNSKSQATKNLSIPSFFRLTFVDKTPCSARHSPSAIFLIWFIWKQSELASKKTRRPHN